MSRQRNKENLNNLTESFRGMKRELPGSWGWALALAILVVLALFFGVLCLGGLAVWGILGLFGVQLGYWACTFTLLGVYIILSILGHAIKKA